MTDPRSPFDHDGGRLADGAEEEADDVQGVEGEEHRDDDSDRGDPLPPEGDDAMDGTAPSG